MVRNGHLTVILGRDSVPAILSVGSKPDFAVRQEER